MVQNILIFLYEGFAEFEITPLSWQLSEQPNFNVITIAYNKEKITSNSGFQFHPDKLVSEIESIAKRKILPNEKIDSTIYDVAKAIKLIGDCNPNMLEILFVDEKAIRFKHKLAGFEEEWSSEQYHHNQMIRYTNLPPGT